METLKDAFSTTKRVLKSRYQAACKAASFLEAFMVVLCNLAHAEHFRSWKLDSASVFLIRPMIRFSWEAYHLLLLAERCCRRGAQHLGLEYFPELQSLEANISSHIGRMKKSLE